jgi:hypothetical protein
MKKTVALSAATLIVLASSRAGAAILTGPITNPVNGHDYYLLSANSWTASEAEAERLGGTLAIIKNAGEQEWVFSTFTTYGETNRNLWIGLSRKYPGGPFSWVTDREGSYSNWAPGQPDNAGNESYVQMFCDRQGRIAGTWNDLANAPSLDGNPNCGVVEVPGKSKEKTLSAAEKALRGNWYLAGKAGSECHVTSTEDTLFVINEGNWAGRVILTAEGRLFVAPRLFGEIVKDRILWSNGTWWSRKPFQMESSARQDSFTLEGLDRAAGKQFDTPIIY